MALVLAPGLVWAQVVRHDIKDAQGRTITYYIGHPAKPAPLLLMIQGSGCGQVVMNYGTAEKPAYGSTLYQFLPYAAEGRFTVMAVEKPFSGAIGKGEAGTAQPCSAAFRKDFTAESWLAALQAALKDARGNPWVDNSRTLVLGESEGTVMASLLASHDPSITDVVWLSGTGTTQLYDFIVSYYRRCPDASCFGELEAQVAAIRADPDSADKMAWGHPYKRWTSFFGVDPTEEMLHSKARLYLAIGTADESVPPLSSEIAVARLTAAGHDVTVRRVPDANHMLMRKGQTLEDGLGKEQRLALDWFWAKKP
jgi:dienelactone hydrolase